MPPAPGLQQLLVRLGQSVPLLQHSSSCWASPTDFSSHYFISTPLPSLIQVQLLKHTRKPFSLCFEDRSLHKLEELHSSSAVEKLLENTKRFWGLLIPMQMGQWKKGNKNSHRTEQFSNDTIKSHFSRGDSALCHFQMLSYCGPRSVLSCHPPADVSLHSLVCKHFAFSRNLFKQYF